MLYHQIEVDLQNPGRLGIRFTIHAPELPSAVAGGVDPAAVDDAWLSSRSNEELAALVSEARSLISRCFEMRFTGNRPLQLEHNLAFGSPETIRRPRTANPPPPACLEATLEAANPGPPQELKIRLAPDAEKRLLLVVTRPGSFPATRDLAAGERTSIPLPNPPPAPEPRIRRILLWILPGVVFVVWILAIRRWNFRT